MSLYKTISFTFKYIMRTDVADRNSVKLGGGSLNVHDVIATRFRFDIVHTQKKLMEYFCLQNFIYVTFLPLKEK